MFTGLHLKNYKSFKKVDIDFRKKQAPKKIIAIYGENGSGKSNIVSAFSGLSQSLDTVRNQANLVKLQEKISESSEDIDAKKATPEAIWLQLIRSGNVTNADLFTIFKDAGMLGSREPVTIQYDFNIGGSEGYYKLVFGRNNDGLFLAEEELYYLIKKASGVLFKLTSDGDGHISGQWSPNIFKKGTMRDLVNDSVARLWGKNTFLAIFKELLAHNNYEYLKQNVSQNFLKVFERFNHLAFREDRGRGLNNFQLLLRNMLHGKLKDNPHQRMVLKTTEDSLNKYFVPLYSDINQMYYETQGNDKESLSYELFEKKRVGGAVIDVPFRLESNGTRRLLDLFPLFLNAVHGETVVVDEIDQGIHDLLIDRLIDNLKDDIQGQLIFTTHDTQVMQELEPSAVYIIQSDTAGDKQVVSLSKNGRANIAANNNIQKMYLSGYFAGIPYADDVDFEDILNGLEVPADEK